jgi:hypothetical protein
MKIKNVLLLAALPLLFAACTPANTEKGEETATESTTQTEENANTIDPVENDALRMGKLACESKSIFDKWKNKEITREAMDAQVAPLNEEMTTISQRFENEYKSDSMKVKKFQTVFESVFPSCENL